MKQQRMTKQKQLVLEVAQARRDHPTADQIYLNVRTLDNHISRGTVYRNLGQLADSGLLTHVKVPGPDRFDYRLDKHFHMICKNCGAVLDAPLTYQEELDRQVFKKSGFQVERHRTVFEGLCPECVLEQAASHTHVPEI